MQKKRKLLWQLYPPIIVIIVITFIGIAIYANYSIRHFYLKASEKQLKVKADLLKRWIVNDSKSSVMVSDTVCEEGGNVVSARITFILPNGAVLCDSREKYELMDNHIRRPEVQDALIKGYGFSLRHSDTLNRDFIYVAVSVEKSGKLVGIIRVATSVTSVTEILHGIYIRIALSCILIVLLVAFAIYIVTHRLNKPLIEIEEGARSFASGSR